MQGHPPQAERAAACRRSHWPTFVRCPLSLTSPAARPAQLGNLLVDRAKYGFLQSRGYITTVDMSADDDDDIPMPATAGQPVRCARAPHFFCGWLRAGLWGPACSGVSRGSQLAR